MLVRKATLLLKFAEKILPSARMLSDKFDNLKTKSFGSWDTKHWDVVFGKLDAHIDTKHWDVVFGKLKVSKALEGSVAPHKMER